MVKKMRQQSVFGASLADSLTDGEDGVPVLVRRLCEAVERRGIETEVRLPRLGCIRGVGLGTCRGGNRLAGLL